MSSRVSRPGKQENKSSAKKRLARTGSGKWKMAKAGRKHLLMQKKKRQKKAVERPTLLSSGEAKKAIKMLPSM